MYTEIYLARLLLGLILVGGGAFLRISISNLLFKPSEIMTTSEVITFGNY